MRKDLNKQLCERARHGHARRYGNIRRNRYLDSQYDVDYDINDEDIDARIVHQQSEHREGIKRRHQLNWNTKSFNEHLSPLYGIIRKAVGRKWDDFYSELKENFDTRSVINNHILEHLYDRIAVGSDLWYDEDGVLMYRGYRGSPAEPITDRGPEYYVDPKDGIIKINTGNVTWREYNAIRRAADKAEKLKTRRVIDGDTELHKIDDVWFEVKYRKVEQIVTYVNHPARYSHYGTTKKHTYPRPTYEYPTVYDVLLKKNVKSDRVAIARRTLSHQELVKHGLV